MSHMYGSDMNVYRYPYDATQSTVTDKVEALLQRLDMSHGMKELRQDTGLTVSVFDWSQVFSCL